MTTITSASVNKVSEMAENLVGSEILKIAGEVNEKIRNGEKIYNLTVGARAVGETMIVVMAAGLSANLTLNPLEAVTTVTVQMVTLLTGDQEFNSPKTLAAFALGLTLFCFTLLLNIGAEMIVKKYREQYD